MERKAAPRILVVYYSRTGITQTVAQRLARSCNADLESLQVTRGRHGLFGYLLSGYEATFRCEAQIKAPERDPRAYDIVLIGTPTWNGAVSSPVLSYLTRLAGSLPEVGFFVTCGGGGADRVLGQLARLCGKAPLAQLALGRRDLRGRWSVYLAEFLEGALISWESRQKSAAE